MTGNMTDTGKGKSDGPHLLLRATEHNWGLISPGDWETVGWDIFSDRSYFMNIRFVSEPGFPASKSFCGKMRETAFIKLRLLLGMRWLDPKIECGGCDGSAWEFRAYRPDGRLLKSTGGARYVYGQKNIEAMIALLPGQKHLSERF